MFYEYMWQKFFMTGNILDYIIFREMENEIEDDMGNFDENAIREPLTV